jgi:hypothetical protein
LTKEDSEDLYNRLLQTVTKYFPEESLSNRATAVMALYQDFHKWATGEGDEAHGVDFDADKHVKLRQ